jgi:hypothetical protein
MHPFSCVIDATKARLPSQGTYLSTREKVAEEIVDDTAVPFMAMIARELEMTGRFARGPVHKKGRRQQPLPPAPSFREEILSSHPSRLT